MGKINFIKGQKNNYKPDNSLNEVYGDGGEVAQKIKDKLAKGSFELPMEMIVYVPSTKDGNVIIPKGDFQARVKNVRAFLATKFGGFSSNPTDGGYMSNDNKGLIEEDVVKVTAFATKEALEENLSPLLKKIQYWCKAWSQESIGFEFEGDLFYISATSKFMGGGMTYRNGSKTWIVMAVTNNGLLLSERLNESITHEEVYNRYKKQGYEVVDSQVLQTTNSDVLDVFKDAVTEFVLEKYDKQIDWDLSILSYKIIDNKMIVGKCVVATIDGNEYEISPNDLLNNQYAKGGMTYGGGGMTEDQDNRTMILRQAKEVAHHVEELNEILSKQPDIDAWVVAKMQDVTTQLSEITHYLDSRVGFRLGGDDIQKVQDSMLANGGEIILGGGNMASVQDSIMARGAKLKSTKLTMSKLRSMIEEYNSEGRKFELLGAYNQLELWSNGNRLEAGSKEDIYRALVRYRFNPKYANGAKLPIDMEEIPNFGSMSDEDIIEFANTVSYYDRMDEGIEEEFTNVQDAMEYLRMTYEDE
jgi:hypothetical protein